MRKTVGEGSTLGRQSRAWRGCVARCGAGVSAPGVPPVSCSVASSPLAANSPRPLAKAVPVGSLPACANGCVRTIVCLMTGKVVRPPKAFHQRRWETQLPGRAGPVGLAGDGLAAPRAAAARLCTCVAGPSCETRPGRFVAALARAP